MSARTKKQPKTAGTELWPRTVQELLDGPFGESAQAVIEDCGILCVTSPHPKDAFDAETDGLRMSDDRLEATATGYLLGLAVGLRLAGGAR